MIVLFHRVKLWRPPPSSPLIWIFVRNWSIPRGCQRMARTGVGPSALFSDEFRSQPMRTDGRKTLWEHHRAREQQSATVVAN